MSTSATALRVRRTDLIFKRLDDGSHVVKDPRSGSYFKLPPRESFLLAMLNGAFSAGQIRAAFERKFQEPLSDEDLEQFVSVAEESGFLCDRQSRPPAEAQRLTRPVVPLSPAPVSPASPAPAPQPRPQSSQRQSLLAWRKSVFDPDRLFARLEPSLRFLWTRSFVILSAAAIAAAVAVSWLNRREIVTDFTSALVARPETLLLAWLTLVVATTLHEFAHGLTCKHFGGEVHEVGFLLLFFIPCFYCNVSDAWLMREKARRLWVTLAGAWCDLCLWAAAVFVWRLTPSETVPHYLAWVLMGVTGVRVFFNFNPLLKLDGYYLLSDAIDMPNLRDRAWERLAGHVRWLLWGAPRPAAEPRAGLLLAFGLLAWLYSALFLCLMVGGFLRWWGYRWGVAGATAALALGALTSRGLFVGFSRGEISAMLRRRKARVATWVVGAAAAVAVLCVVPLRDRAGGPFKLRALRRAEVRAPVAGFLREVRFAEGQRVAAGAVVVRMEVPDLSSKVTQKEAEVAEAVARLSILRAEADAPVETRRGGDDGRIKSWQILAGEAQVSRLREELKYLLDLQRRQPVASPVAGLVVTPHLVEKVGQYLREGELICEVEDSSTLEAEIAVPEQDMARVREGQAVELKARVAPFDTLRARVTRIATGVRVGHGSEAAAGAATAAPELGELPGKLIVSCTLDGSASAAGARPGMTGYARIDCGQDPAGKVIGRRLLQYIRTEFWW
jgi:multidrug efflux pump subunit AcrA (membrane-fusion protein)